MDDGDVISMRMPLGALGVKELSATIPGEVKTGSYIILTESSMSARLVIDERTMQLKPNL